MEPIKRKDPRPICFATTCFFNDGEHHCDCALQYNNARGICGTYRDRKETEEMIIKFENFNGIKIFDKDKRKSNE